MHSRKLRPFWGVWQATRKDGCSRIQSTLDLLLRRPVAVVVWWEKTHPKVKAVFWDTGPCVDNITGLQLVLSCSPWSDGKGKGQFTSQGGWNAFHPAKAISNPDTSSLSPAVVQVLSRPKPRWSRPLIVGSARLHPPLHRTVRILANSNSGLEVERSSNTRGDGRRQCYFYICDSAVIATGTGVNFCVASVMCRFLHMLV